MQVDSLNITMTRQDLHTVMNALYVYMENLRSEIDSADYVGDEKSRTRDQRRLHEVGDMYEKTCAIYEGTM